MQWWCRVWNNISTKFNLNDNIDNREKFLSSSLEKHNYKHGLTLRSYFQEENIGIANKYLNKNKANPQCN